MDKELGKQIAEAVAAQLSSHTTMVLVVQTVILLIAVTASAYFGEYLRARGKHLATKADFESLKEQLHTNTVLVERIRSQVSREDWAQREWANLRRLKLEELMQKRLECIGYLQRLETAAYEDGKSLDERNPAFDFDVVASLYFPEIRSITDNFLNSFEGMRRQILALAGDVGVAIRSETSKEWARQKYSAAMKAQNPKFSEAGEQLIDQARELLPQIMAVR